MKLKILGALAALVGAFLAYVALKDSHYEISREITIQASPERIFPYINTRSLANSWNPFLKQDPGLKVAYEGPEVGVGAATKWEGGKNVGTGSATVIESVPNERVVVRLDYLKPFQGTQRVVYLLRREGNQSVITWTVSGQNAFLPRLLCMFMSMDKMVGSAFERGLAELKEMVEKGTQ